MANSVGKRVARFVLVAMSIVQWIKESMERDSR